MSTYLAWFSLGALLELPRQNGPAEEKFQGVKESAFGNRIVSEFGVSSVSQFRYCRGDIDAIVL
jgi:hypothetical protein